jgi:hypothetical protein
MGSSIKQKQTNNKNIYSDGFIILLWEKVFRFLSYISIFCIIKKIKKGKINSVFVEKWVLFNLVFSIISSVIIYHTKIKPIAIILIIYGLLRAFEVIVYQINVLLFDPYRAHLIGKPYTIKSPTRMVILLIHNYLELIFWFAVIYISLNILSDFPLTIAWSSFIKASVFCFVNNDMSFVQDPGFANTISLFAYFEMVGGMVMTLISLARFIGLLPNVEFEEKI